MIYSLSERSKHIYEYVERNIDKNTFTEINSKEDQSKSLIKVLKSFLESVKILLESCIYILLKTKDGSLVYVVDGLNSSRSDFRNAGDLIEKRFGRP